jgi:hypothetical protein
MSSKKKTNTTTSNTSTANTATNNTTTAVNPSWVTSSVQGVQDKINGLLTTDPSTLVSGPSALQNQAFTGASDLTTSPLFGQAADMAAATAGKGPATTSAASLLDGGLERFYNPYQQQVIDSTMASSDAADGRTRAQQTLDIARNQKFGGSGSAITRALTEGELQRGRAQTEATLRSAGFDKATGLAVSDADRRQSANNLNASLADSAMGRETQIASLLGNLGSAEGADARANIGLLGDLGGTQRAITQDQIAAPTELLKLISALNSGQNYGLFTGQQSTGTSNGTTTSDGTSNTVESGGQLAALLSGLGGLGTGLGALGFGSAK